MGCQPSTPESSGGCEGRNLLFAHVAAAKITWTAAKVCMRHALAKWLPEDAAGAAPFALHQRPTLARARRSPAQ